MQVRHRLAAIVSLINYQAESVYQGLRKRDSLYGGKQSVPRRVVGGQLLQAVDVGLGDDQYMNWSLRIDVADRHNMLGFKNTIRLNVTACNAAEWTCLVQAQFLFRNGGASIPL